jgi:hypothetical protein
MKRRGFFKKSILGAIAIWKAPEILAKTSTPKIKFKPIPMSAMQRYDDIKLLTELQSQLNINLQDAILTRMDIHWTPEELETLLNSRRPTWQMETVSQKM